MWQEESVYNLIPRPAEEIVKPPMYRSKHDATVPPSCSTFGLQGTSKLTANNSGAEEAAGSKRMAATFGREVVSTVDPHTFLKKGLSTSQRAAAPAESRKSLRRTVSECRPPVPRRDEKPVMGLTTDKNFIVANAVENILAVPRKPKAEGPLPTQNRNFAKVPAYLSKIKNDLAEEKAYLQQLNKQKSEGERERMRPMTDDEKNDIIAGLKRKWHETHKQYQAMTFTFDTITKVQRKEALEVEMEQIEKAIEKLSKKNIHVYDDSELW